MTAGLIEEKNESQRKRCGTTQGKLPQRSQAQRDRRRVLLAPGINVRKAAFTASHLENAQPHRGKAARDSFLPDTV
jgi:hypothetical protein